MAAPLDVGVAAKTSFYQNLKSKERRSSSPWKTCFHSLSTDFIKTLVQQLSPLVEALSYCDRQWWADGPSNHLTISSPLMVPSAPLQLAQTEDLPVSVFVLDPLHLCPAGRTKQNIWGSHLEEDSGKMLKYLLLIEPSCLKDGQVTSMWARLG